MLYLSEAAATELRKSIASSGRADARFRVFIERLCNCGRPRFGLSLDETPDKDWTWFEVNGVPFVADDETVPRLSAVEIDYASNWMQRGIAIKNIDECATC